MNITFKPLASNRLKPLAIISQSGKIARSICVCLMAFGVLLVTGCQSVTRPAGLYSWGEYENVLHSQFTKPGKMPAARQVEILERDITKAQQRGWQVAPGVYAQLGTALADLGQRDAAESAFRQEIALYPESAVLIERMLKRANQTAPRQGDAL